MTSSVFSRVNSINLRLLVEGDRGPWLGRCSHQGQNRLRVRRYWHRHHCGRAPGLRLDLLHQRRVTLVINIPKHDQSIFWGNTKDFLNPQDEIWCWVVCEDWRKGDKDEPLDFVSLRRMNSFLSARVQETWETGSSEMGSGSASWEESFLHW